MDDLEQRRQAKRATRLAHALGMMPPHGPTDISLDGFPSERRPLLTYPYSILRAAVDQLYVAGWTFRDMRRVMIKYGDQHEDQAARMLVHVVDELAEILDGPFDMNVPTDEARFSDAATAAVKIALVLLEYYAAQLATALAVD